MGTRTVNDGAVFSEPGQAIPQQEEVKIALPPSWGKTDMLFENIMLGKYELP